VHRRKWLIALGVVAIAFFGVTFVDKQREQDCRDGALLFLKEQPSASEQTITNIGGDGECDGFLPW
jgi:hypothetical protein